MMLLDKICERIYMTGVRLNGEIPRVSADINGKWTLTEGGGWTDSFFVGEVYLAYAYTKDRKFLDIADKYQDYFIKRAENDIEWCESVGARPLDHDTGFIFKLSQVLRYRLTGDMQAHRAALDAAGILAERFNKNGNFIRAWDFVKGESYTEESYRERMGLMIIDSMMNLSLLLWAAEESGNKSFYDIAVRHADSVRKHIIREDGSTYHMFAFDPDSGEPLYGKTGQGYSNSSCWARGQAWAIYGFTQVYDYTKQTRFLEAALKTARYFTENLTPSGLPIWDFECKDKIFRPFDASAAAVAISGLCSLQKYSDEQFIKKGIAMLRSGIVNICLAIDVDGYEPILMHSCVGPAYREEDDKKIILPYVDCAMTYADYYFTEYLLKSTGEYDDLLK